MPKIKSCGQLGTHTPIAKVVCICAMSRSHITATIFFDSTITAEAYLDIIFQFVSSLEKHEWNTWFQQDNAQPHVARSTVELLRSFFQHCLIFIGLCPTPPPSTRTPNPHWIIFCGGTLRTKCTR